MYSVYLKSPCPPSTAMNVFRSFGTLLLQCWCGSSKDKPDRHGKSTKCTMDCAGEDRIKKCGGYLAMDVFEHEGKPDDVPKGAKYLGCFADDNQDRALTLKNKSNSKMDYAVRMEVSGQSLIGSFLAGLGRLSQKPACLFFYCQ